MRFIIPALLFCAIDWYAFQAVLVVTEGMGRTTETGLTIIYWAIPVLTLCWFIALARGWTSRWPRSLKVLVRTLIVIVYFSKMMIAVVLLVDDMRRLTVVGLEALELASDMSAGRSVLLSKIGLGLGALPLVLLTYGVARNQFRYKVHKVTILVDALPTALEGLRIVQISDIHAGSFLAREPVRRSIEMINALDPDLVVFTGDLVNSSAREADPFVDIFAGIRSRYGVYSVLGNHDYGDYQHWPSREAKQANFALLAEQHARMGWRLLRNEHVVINIEDASLGLIGVENYSAHPRFPKYGDVRLATSGMPGTDINVLLSHDPSHWLDEIVPGYPDIVLTLSGHTHGFQFGIEIPGLIKWSPVQYVYKQWAGLYQRGSQYLYVNRGLGYLGYPGRVGILPEITLLTLGRRRGQDGVS